MADHADPFADEERNLRMGELLEQALDAFEKGRDWSEYPQIGGFYWLTSVAVR